MSQRTKLADLVRSGLKRDDAIKAVTLNAAKIIGLEEKAGSIENGKRADLVFLDGDILDPLAKVKRVIILGETVWTAED